MKYISSSPSRPPQKDIIIKAKYQDKIALLKLDEIYYFEAKLNDTIARTKDGEYFTHKKISDLELLLEDTNFVKVHRSHLVNMTKISYVETIEQGKYRIYFQDINDIIYTSRAGAQELRNIFDYMI